MSVEITAGKDASAALSKEIKTAWREHNAAYARKPEARAEQTPAFPSRNENQGPDAAPERKADRFGRSRDRQPRTPRAERAARGETGSVRPAPQTVAKAENSSVEAGYLAGQFPAPETQEATHAQPEATQEQNSGHETESTPDPSRRSGSEGVWTKEERQARINAEHERQERLQEERGRGSNDNDTGRTMEP